MTKLTILALAIATSFLSGCTSNERARSFGGSEEIKLPVGQRLVTATWKQNSLWTLTRTRHSGELPEVFEFRERSEFGLMEGVVTIREQ